MMKIVPGGGSAAALSWISRFMKRLGGGQDDDPTITNDTFDSSLIGAVWQSKDAAQAFDEGEIKSLELEGPSKRLSICFRNLTPHTILYCWISPSGHLRGFRPLKPSEIVTGPVVQGEHVEQSYLGHAFVFCEMPEEDDSDGSDKKDACKKSEWWRHDVENLDKLHVIGAYRPSSLKPESSTEDKAPEEKDDKKTNGKKDDEEKALVEDKDTDEEDDSDDSDSDSDDDDLDYLFCHVVSIEPRKPTIFDCCCLPESSSSGGSTSHLRHNKKRHIQTVPSSSGNLYTVSACVQPMAKVTLIDTCQTKRYTECHLSSCDWPVRIEQAWPLNGDKELYKLLHDDLTYALSCIPEHAREQLRQKQTLLWINKTFSYGPASNPIQLRNLCFHPAARWLVRNKMHKTKAGCVELYNTAQYCKDRNLWGPGGIFIHEFSHAYHYKCLPNGYDNKEIQDCYDAAMKEGLYDCIEFHSSTTQNGEKKSTARAYACENCMEYWAELSTAFLGGTSSWRKQSKQEEFNKWFPFNRAQLKKHDPRAYQLLQKLWKVQDNDEQDEE